MLDKTEKLYVLANDDIVQGYKGPEYGQCILAWESHSRANQFKSEFEIANKIQKMSLQELELMAWEINRNIIVNLVVGMKDHDLIDILEWKYKFPKDVEKLRQLVSFNGLADAITHPEKQKAR